MYSFTPLVDISDVHVGFYTVLIMCIVIYAAFLWACSEDGFQLASWHAIPTALFFVIIGIAYNDSYTPQHPINQQVTGTFVRFQPEGYRESTGKTRSDVHYMYVIYDVDGYEIILGSVYGSKYPKTAILYKN